MENNRVCENIKVSVIIAYKDRIDHLIRCLDAWSQVDYSNLELILVDDGSDGDYSNLIRELYLNTKIIHLENLHQDRTPAIAFNTGFKASSGDFIIYTDEDMIFGCPDLVQRMLDYYTGYRITLKTYFLTNYHTNLLDGIDWKHHPNLLHTLAGFWEYHRYDAQTTNQWLHDHWFNPVVTFLTGQYRKDWEYLGPFREDKTQLTRDQDIVQRERALHKEAVTLPEIACYHQFHPEPHTGTGPGYRYESEAQARLLEPAPHE